MSKECICGKVKLEWRSRGANEETSEISEIGSTGGTQDGATIGLCAFSGDVNQTRDCSRDVACVTVRKSTERTVLVYSSIPFIWMVFSQDTPKNSKLFFKKFIIFGRISSACKREDKSPFGKKEGWCVSLTFGNNCWGKTVSQAQ